MAAIMSGFVFQQKLVGDALPTLSENLTKIKDIIEDIARNIGQHQQASGLKETVDDFVENIKFGLVEVAHEWAKGTVISF